MTANQPNHTTTAARAGELREDPLSGRVAVVAAGRADRPAAFAPRPGAAAGTAGRTCPFCAGNEGLTPPEVWADRDPGTRPDTPGWRIRVVPNKYPAFTASSGNGRRPSDGDHEVVVHGPAHHTTLVSLPDETLAGMVATWRGRLAALRPAWAGTVLIIANEGRGAGATLEHSHSQVYATAFRPALIDAEAARLTGPACAACALVAEERAAGTRVVADHDGLVTLCPWASGMPMEALILPADRAAGHAGFETGGEELDAALAGAIGDALGRLRAAVGFDPPLNLVLHTAPPGQDDFHWHLHLYPRLSIHAGFELGTGVTINAVDPDDAAARLRAADPARP